MAMAVQGEVTGFQGFSATRLQFDSSRNKFNLHQWYSLQRPDLQLVSVFMICLKFCCVLQSQIILAERKTECTAVAFI